MFHSGIFTTGLGRYRSVKGAAPVWYRAGGAPAPLWVYSPFGAANYGASKINIVNPGTYDADEGSQPSWATDVGWTFSGTTWLTSDCAPAEGDTLLVMFDNPETTEIFMAGALNAGTVKALALALDGDGAPQYWAGDYASGSDEMLRGVLCVAGSQGYRNGVADGDPLTWGSSISDKIAIGRLAGWTGNQWQGDILHAALWRDTLTPYQVHAVYLALREQLSRIVYFGDSITDGTGASDDAHRWRSIVSAAMGYISSINSGVASTTLQNTAQNSVDTIGDAVDDNGYDTCYERVFVYQPGKVAILYGLNDLRLNDEAFSVTAFQNQLLEIVNALAESGLRPANVYIGSPPYIPEDSYADYEPWDGGSREKHDQYRDACANVAASSGAHFVDVYQYMTDNGDDDLIDEDGIHPNDDGHAAIAAAFLAEMA